VRAMGSRQAGSRKAGAHEPLLPWKRSPSQTPNGRCVWPKQIARTPWMAKSARTPGGGASSSSTVGLGTSVS
jgi:hypothetical protein